MKRIYPEYRKKGISKERLYKQLSPKDKETLDKFIRTLSCGENKLNDIKTSLLQFLDIIEKQLEMLNLNDIREYNALLGKSKRKPYTTNGMKVHVKKFLRFCFKDWSERFDNFRDLKQNSRPFNEEKINENTLLKKTEIELIMKKEPNLMKKTFFITLYESGLRPIELRNLKWKDINFNVDGDLTQLNIFATKTGKARAVYIKEATHYLKLLEQNKLSEYIFYSREGHGRISKETAFHWIKELGRGHLKREIFPYILRHSRATELYKSINPKLVQKFLGHGNDMSDFYAHLSSQDVKEAMIKSIYNFEDLPPEKKAEYDKRIAELEDKINLITKVFFGKKGNSNFEKNLKGAVALGILSGKTK